MRKWIGKGEGAAPKKKSKLIEKETNIIKVKYEIKGIWNTEIPQSDDLIFDELQIPNAGQHLEPGEPSLPQEGIYVAIPEGATVTDVRVTKTKMKEYELDNQVKPAPEPTTDPSSLPELNPKQEIYENEDAFPGVLFKNIGTTKVGDINVVHLMMYPVQYLPTSNTIELYKKIELEVEYELGAEKAPPMRGVPTRARKRVPAGYEDQLLNLENV